MGNIGFKRVCQTLALTLAAGAAGALAQSAEDCVSIKDQQARLACYDQLHGRGPATSAPTQRQTAPAAAEEAPITQAPAQPAANPRSDQEAAQQAAAAGTTDLGAEQLPKPREAQDQKADEMLSAIRSMGEGITGRHWFRLENDQLWEQVSPESTTLRAGDAVRVSRGLLGTYHLRREDGGSRSTSVRRRE